MELVDFTARSAPAVLAYVQQHLGLHARPAHAALQLLQPLLADRVTPMEQDLLTLAATHLTSLRALEARVRHWLESADSSDPLP